MKSFSTEELAQMTPDDREQILDFGEFLQAFGPYPSAPEDKVRLKALVESDPDRWLPYLGLRREWARENGYDV